MRLNRALWLVHYSHMTNHPGKPSIQTKTWVSIHPNLSWVGYHPLKAVGTSIFTHGQVCLYVSGVSSSASEEIVQIVADVRFIPSR